MDNLINKIHLGDSFEFMQKLPDNCIDLIVADPPYILEAGGGKTSYLREDKARHMLNSIKDGFDCENYFKEWDRICKSFNAFIFCSNKQILPLLKEAEKLNALATMLIWHKTNTTPFCNMVWRPDIEYILHIRKKGATFIGNAKDKQKVYTSPTEISKYGHPTEKPMDLIKKYIKIGSNEGDIVLDPFMGSGTTANACIHLQRNFIGCEIDEKYHKTACERVDRAYGNVGLFK